MVNKPITVLLIEDTREDVLLILLYWQISEIKQYKFLLQFSQRYDILKRQTFVLMAKRRLKR